MVKADWTRYVFPKVSPHVVVGSDELAKVDAVLLDEGQICLETFWFFDLMGT